MELRTRTTRASWRNSDDPHRHSPYPLSNVLKEELTKPYKKVRATGGMSNHQARDAENAKIFKDMYSVCTIGSSYHDLTCGHRIQSKYPGASCGVNCKGKKVKKEEQEEVKQHGKESQHDEVPYYNPVPLYDVVTYYNNSPLCNKETQYDEVPYYNESPLYDEVPYYDGKTHHHEEIRHGEENQLGKNQLLGKPFVCGDCIAAGVRLRMLLKGIALSNEDEMMDDERQAREQTIRALADAEINKLMKQHHRMCTVTDKFEDPTLQFFDQFMKEAGFGGIHDVKENPNVPRQLVTRKIRKAPKPDRKIRKVAKRNVGKNWQPREPVKQVEDDKAKEYVRSLAQMEQDEEANGGIDEPIRKVRIGLELEDDVTKAVREGLMTCSLG
jgi:hypothetical protein